jgi:integrase
LQALVRGFKGSALFPIVAVLAFTGARRSEVLALRWEDIDVSRKMLRIERAIEQTKRYGLRLKGPKKEIHKRTITVAERDRHLRIVAGIPDARPLTCHW